MSEAYLVTTDDAGAASAGGHRFTGLLPNTTYDVGVLVYEQAPLAQEARRIAAVREFGAVLRRELRLDAILGWIHARVTR